MSASTASSPSAPLPQEPVHLNEDQVFLGVLSDIIEPDGENFVLPVVEGCLVEVPKSLGPELWKLRGQKIIIGHFDGQFRAGVSHI